MWDDDTGASAAKMIASAASARVRSGASGGVLSAADESGPDEDEDG
jgi:hypothetical protein